ncbi:hypothetical protein, partial [Vreelandella titanicae]|uniref:hypothetical protein n=1 Tax=Vreelandella titanicae TaxID=664683 RepID=UPI003FD8E2C0
MRSHAHIVLAGSRDIANIGQLLTHFFGVRHQSISGHCLDMRGNLGAGLGVSVWVLSVGFMAGLYMPEALGVVWPRP